jgi:ABC-2 type transport system ATP-binding protein
MAKGSKVFDGTIAEAKQTLPRRVRLESSDSVDQLRELEGVLGVEALNVQNGAKPGAEAAKRWELRIAEKADPQSILQECFTRGIRLRSFELSDPSLHEVFVHLVGPDAKEAAFR